jgi:hypothetical protein
VLELRLKFPLYFRRQPLRLRKKPKQSGIASFYLGNRPCGVFPIARVAMGFGNAGEREAHLYIRPDEINADGPSFTVDRHLRGPMLAQAFGL